MSDIIEYEKWEDGMYVLLSDLQDEYEVSLVFISLMSCGFSFTSDYLKRSSDEDAVGIHVSEPMIMWAKDGDLRLTRNQALKLAGVEI